MTLSKQVMIAMSMIVLLLLATAMFVNYKNTEGFIKDQLYSNASNTASSLGVALGYVTGDKAMEETLINAVFDSGYYESITLLDIDGNVSFESREPIKVQDVPSWFIKSIHFDSTEADVPLSSNWRLTGHLKISGHRGHAYEQIWHAFKEMVMGFAILGLLALVGIFIMLKVVLSPLKHVREQAEAVIERRFIIQEHLPKTKEMHDVVNAMNLLVNKVKLIYEKEAKAVADYNRLLFEDRETGYYNRAYFRIKIEEYLKSSDYHSHGYVLAFEIHNYAKLLDEKGANGVYKAVMNLRDIINEHCCSSFREAVRCRTRDNDIMIILPSSLKDDVEKFARAVCESSTDGYEIDCAYITYDEGETLSKIMEKIGSALMMAGSIENESVHIYAGGKDDIPLLSHDEWKVKINESIDNNSFIPMLQPAKDKDKEEHTVHNEVLLRMEYDGEILSAGLFMPIISGIKMISNLDRYVLERLETLKTTDPLAVNITHDFISQSENLQVISSLSERWKDKGMDVFFELPNTIIASYPEASKTFATHIRREGWKLGIDHFTIGAYDLNLLEELKPKYLKINAAYLLSLVEGKKDDVSKSSLLTIADLLGIDIIAMSVDSDETVNRLKENGITQMQGFWIAEPKEERN